MGPVQGRAGMGKTGRELGMGRFGLSPQQSIRRVSRACEGVREVEGRGLKRLAVRSLSATVLVAAVSWHAAGSSREEGGKLGG